MSPARHFLVAVLLLAASFPARLHSDPRVSASSTPGGFVVFADSLPLADLAVLEAEKIQQRFQRMFGLEASKSNLPIVMVLGGGEWKFPPADGVVRVFQNRRDLKLQINWDGIPIPSALFRRGWIRALATRQAVDSPVAGGRRSVSSRGPAELRVPIWVTEGLSTLVAEPLFQEEILGRATLLAHLEPGLALDEVLLELEGRSDLDPWQGALASALCRALVQDGDVRARFVKSLNWAPEISARQWLQGVVGSRPVDEWWRDAWKNQGSQFTWVRMGFPSSLNGCVALDGRVGGDSPPPLPMQVESLLSPWFGSLVKRWHAGAGDPDLRRKMEEGRREIILRRMAALGWFAPYEVLPERAPASDWLIWARLQGLERESSPTEGRGPSGTWFESKIRDL